MRKIYKLNQPKNTATFTLTGKTGNTVLDNEYYQWLLEHSSLFKNGIVKLLRVIDTSGDSVSGAKPKEEMTAVESIKTVGQAVDYVATEWGVKVKTAKEAKEEAAKHGVSFPNLKTKAE